MAKPHTDLVNVCLDWLALQGIMAWANNTGGMKKGKHYIKFGKEGSSDIIGILPGGYFLGVECKVPPDELSPAQAVFTCDVLRAGGIAITVECLEDLQEALTDA